MRPIAIAVLCLINLVVVTGVVAADPFEEGVAAYQQGKFDEARKLWEPLAEKGEAAAQFNLGVLYAEGQGVVRDDNKAGELYRKAADQGYAPAQFNLGVMYEAGRGVDKDLTRAAKLWQQAAEQDFVQAQYNLATLYFYGRGVDKDLREARRWFARAAQLGDAAAARALETVEKRMQAEGIAVETVAAEKPKQQPAPAASAPQPDSAAATSPATRPAPEILDAAWIRKQPADHYTIQLFANWTEESILTFIKEHGLTGKIAYYKVLHESKPWFCLIQGNYANADAAQSALRAAPAKLRVMGAFVRSFGDVQTVIARGSVEPNGGAANAQAPEPAAQARAEQASTPAPAVQPDVTEAMTGPPPTVSGSKQAAEPQPETVPPPAPVPQPETAQLLGEDWLLKQDSGRYGIQLYANWDEAVVRKLAAELSLDGPLAMFQALYQGRPWFTLIYGSFASVAEAKPVLASLPQSLRSRGAWIRGFGSVHKAIAERDQAGSASPQKEQKRETEQAPRTEPSAAATVPAQPQPVAVGKGTAAQQRALRDGQSAFNAGKYKKAVSLWNKLAQDGVAEAQYNMGFVYESGWGVERDDIKAAEWYRKAAVQQHLTAMFNLGLILVERRAPTQDAEQAMDWVRRAAEQGLVSAQDYLARAYRDGLNGLPRDPQTADYWSNKAAAAR